MSVLLCDRDEVIGNCGGTSHKHSQRALKIRNTIDDRRSLLAVRHRLPQHDQRRGDHDGGPGGQRERQLAPA